MSALLKPLPDLDDAPPIHVLPDAPAAAPAAEPAKPKRAGKLSLGGIATAKPDSKATKVYPKATLTDEEREMVSELLRQKREAKALEGSIKVLGAEMQSLVMPQWFAKAQGQHEPPSSIVVPGVEKDGVTEEGMLVIAGETGGRYTGTAEAAVVEQIAALVGEDLFAEHFTEKVTLKVELDKVPEEKQQALVNALLAVFEEHGANDAVTAANVTVLQPLSRRSRFQVFDLETNNKLHALLPLIPTFKAR